MDADSEIMDELEDQLAVLDEEDSPLLVGDYDPQLVSPWIDYLYGKWEKGDPELPGWYALMTCEGHVVGYREFIMRDGKVVDPKRGYKEPGWLGYRWSVSLPVPPMGTP